MFTNPEEIAVPDVADNFLSGPSWCGAGLLCHPSDQLPILCLITELTDLFTNATKISSTIFALVLSQVYTESNCPGFKPSFFAALEAHSQAEWPSSEAEGSSSLAPPPPPWAVLDNAEAAPGCAAPWEELPGGVQQDRTGKGGELFQQPSGTAVAK